MKTHYTLLNRNLVYFFQYTLLIIQLVFPSLSQADTEAEAVYRYCSESVVMVITNGKNGIVQGSGVVIENNKVVTNWHVIDGNDEIIIKHKGNSYSAKYIYANPEWDVTILETRSLPSPTSLIGSVENVKIGENVYAIGNPSGLELTLTTGIVSGKRHVDGITVIQTSAPISPGSSGGGLFNAKMELIGITTLFIKDGQNLNFAIPVDLIKKHINKSELDQSLESDINTRLEPVSSKYRMAIFSIFFIALLLVVATSLIFLKNERVENYFIEKMQKMYRFGIAFGESKSYFFSKIDKERLIYALICIMILISIVSFVRI